MEDKTKLISQNEYNLGEMEKIGIEAKFLIYSGSFPAQNFKKIKMEQSAWTLSIYTTELLH